MLRSGSSEDRLSHLAERSIQTERERAKPINDQFGSIAVSRITVDDVTSYIRERKAAGRANATVNRELDIIRGVLKKAKRWHLFADDIKPLPVRQTIGRAMSYEEKTRLLKVAAARPEWQNTAWAATLALNTTMRGVEIKNLCWRDVDFFRRTLTVRRSKTDAGLRSIPLNDDAWNHYSGTTRTRFEIHGRASAGALSVSILRAQCHRSHPTDEELEDVHGGS